MSENTMSLNQETERMPKHQRFWYSGVQGKRNSGTVEYTERCPGREDGNQHNAYCNTAERSASVFHVGSAEGAEEVINALQVGSADVQIQCRAAQRAASDCVTSRVEDLAWEMSVNQQQQVMLPDEQHFHLEWEMRMSLKKCQQAHLKLEVPAHLKWEMTAHLQQAHLKLEVPAHLKWEITAHHSASRVGGARPKVGQRAQRARSGDSRGSLGQGGTRQKKRDSRGSPTAVHVGTAMPIQRLRLQGKLRTKLRAKHSREWFTWERQLRQHKHSGSRGNCQPTNEVAIREWFTWELPNHNHDMADVAVMEHPHPHEEEEQVEWKQSDEGDFDEEHGTTQSKQMSNENGFRG